MKDILLENLRNRRLALNCRINYLLDEMDIKVAEVNNLTEEKEKIQQKIKEIENGDTFTT